MNASAAAILEGDVATGGTRLLAVGTAAGIVPGFDRLPDGGGLIRLGDHLLSVDPTRYRLWEAVHVAPTCAALRSWAQAAAIAVTLVESLQDTGLVVEWPEDRQGRLGLAHHLAVRFVGRFLGNGGQGDPVFLLGDASSRPVARVDLLLYEFLLWADGPGSIVDQCARLDTRSFEESVDPVQHVVAALPSLMRVGLIRLDARMHDDGS